MPLEFYNLLFINYAGRRQDGLVLDWMKRELSKLTGMVSKTLELKEEIRPSKENQTTGDEIKQLALKFQTWAFEVRVKVNFKEKRVKIVTKRITSFWKHHIYVNLIIAIINKD